MTAIIALPREIGGTDPAAQANWWSDYAEHATILAVAGVLAASRGPGWRILRYTCAAVWLYLGFVATFVLPHHAGSWSTSAVSPQSLSAWVSQSPHGEEWSTEDPDLYDRDPRLNRTRIDGRVTRGGES